MSIHFDENLSDLKTFLLHKHYEFLPAVINFTQLLFNRVSYFNSENDFKIALQQQSKKIGICW